MQGKRKARNLMKDKITFYIKNLKVNLERRIKRIEIEKELLDKEKDNLRLELEHLKVIQEYLESEE